jgi:hypothetical protein
LPGASRYFGCGGTRDGARFEVIDVVNGVRTNDEARARLRGTGRPSTPFDRVVVAPRHLVDTMAAEHVGDVGPECLGAAEAAKRLPGTVPLEGAAEYALRDLPRERTSLSSAASGDALRRSGSG